MRWKTEPNGAPPRGRGRIVSLAMLFLAGITTSLLILGIARSALSGAPDSPTTAERETGRRIPDGNRVAWSVAQTGEHVVPHGSGSRSTQIRVEAVARVLNMAVVTAFAVLWFRWRRR